jgi:thiamine-phosphate pyrophosphorylase
VNRLPRLYAIADAAFGDPVVLGRRLFASGARLVQIRDKNASARTLLASTFALVAAAPGGARVIVNDRADVALLGGAGGVHLGQEDLPPHEVRELLGPDSLVGLSTHSVSQARETSPFDLDYIAAGPVFPTGSRRDPAPVIGLGGLRDICRASARPVVAIGGIRLESLPAVFDAGASAVAVIADLLGQADLERRVGEYLGLLDRLQGAGR